MEYQGKRFTPLKAIRAHCLWCCGDSHKEVNLCLDYDCPLWPYRMGSITKGASRKILQVIRDRCLYCCCDSHEMVRTCTAYQKYVHPLCTLWPFRMGKNPNYSKEHRQKARRRAVQNTLK